MHIAEQTWANVDQVQIHQLEPDGREIPKEIREIRASAIPTKLQHARNPIHEWVAKDYTDKGIKTPIMGIKITNRMASMAAHRKYRKRSERH